MSNFNLDNRVIREFISSIFCDKQDERDELMKKRFPCCAGNGGTGRNADGTGPTLGHYPREMHLCIEK